MCIIRIGELCQLPWHTVDCTSYEYWCKMVFFSLYNWPTLHQQSSTHDLKRALDPFIKQQQKNIV